MPLSQKNDCVIFDFILWIYPVFTYFRIIQCIISAATCIIIVYLYILYMYMCISDLYQIVHIYNAPSANNIIIIDRIICIAITRRDREHVNETIR